MPRTPSLEAKKDKSNSVDYDRWVVTTPGSMSPDGKLHRTYYRDQDDAEKNAAKLRRAYHRGLRHATIDPVLARQATDAAEILKPYNVSIVDLAKAYAEKAEKIGSRILTGKSRKKREM